MMAAPATPRPIESLPEVRGKLEENAPLSRYTWFGTGGPADILFRPADAVDLADFLADLPADVPITVIGLGSNLLVRDGGIPGVVIRLGKAFGAIEADGDHVFVGAGAVDIAVASAARDVGIAGLEFLRGIPGSIGGALAMNAGAYGREMKDIVVSATALDRTGIHHKLALEDFEYRYRSSAVPPDWIFTSAALRGWPGEAAEIAARMTEIADAREDSQPLRTRTGGSTFKNPDGARAWELIDRAGCRGLAIGDAQVSEKHCNFLINRGRATSDDLEALGEEVRRRVAEETGVSLEWEIKRIGRRVGERQ